MATNPKIPQTIEMFHPDRPADGRRTVKLSDEAALRKQGFVRVGERPAVSPAAPAVPAAPVAVPREPASPGSVLMRHPTKGDLVVPATEEAQRRREGYIRVSEEPAIRRDPIPVGSVLMHHPVKGHLVVLTSEEAQRRSEGYVRVVEPEPTLAPAPPHEPIPPGSVLMRHPTRGYAVVPNVDEALRRSEGYVRADPPEPTLPFTGTIAMVRPETGERHGVVEREVDAYRARGYVMERELRGPEPELIYSASFLRDLRRLIRHSDPKIAAPAGALLEALAAEPRPTEPRPTEPRPTEPRPTEPWPTEPWPTEPHPTEPRPTEPPRTEPPRTEPRPTEPRPTEPRPTEPTEPEPEPPYTRPEPPPDPDPTEPPPPPDPTPPAPPPTIPPPPAVPRDPGLQTKRTTVVEIGPDGSEGQIAKVLNNRSDVMVLLKPGDYKGPHQFGRFTHSATDKGTILGSALTIASKDPANPARIFPQGITGDTFNFSQGQSKPEDIAFEDLIVCPGGRSAVFFNSAPTSHKKIALRRVDINGLLQQPRTQTINGRLENGKVKWLITGYDVDDLLIEDSDLHDVFKSGDFQQCIYLHTHDGPVTIRRSKLRNCGRSAVQSRNPEFDTAGKTLTPARGKFLMEDVLVEGAGRMDGGFSLTFYAEEDVELRRVTVRETSAADTLIGGLIFWCTPQGGKNGMHSYTELGRQWGTGKVLVEDCVIDMKYATAQQRIAAAFSEIEDLTIINTYFANPGKLGVELERPSDGKKPNGKETFWGNSFGPVGTKVARHRVPFTAAQLAAFTGSKP